MSTKKISYPEQLATLFVNTFTTQRRVMDFIIEAYQLCIYYSGDKEKSKDAAYTLNVMGRELGLTWMRSPEGSAAGESLAVGAKCFMDSLSETVIKNATTYLLRSIVAHASDEGNGTYSKEYINMLTSGIDFLLEAAKLTSEYNIESEHQSNELKRA